MKEPNRLLFKFSTTLKELISIPKFTLCQINQIRSTSATGSRSLIHQLSSPASTFKAQNTKRHLNCSPSKYKGRHDFPSQKRNQSTPLLLSRTRRRRK